MDALRTASLPTLLLLAAVGCAGPETTSDDVTVTATPWRLDDGQTADVVAVDGVRSPGAAARVIEVDVDGHTLRMELTRNEALFGPAYTEHVLGADGAMTEVPAELRADARPCYYLGTVTDLSDPTAAAGRAAVATCTADRDEVVTAYLRLPGQDLELRPVGQTPADAEPAYELVPADRPAFIDDLDDLIDVGTLPGTGDRPELEDATGPRPPPPLAWVEVHAVSDTYFVAQEGSASAATARAARLVNAAGGLYYGELTPETRLVLAGQTVFAAEPYTVTVDTNGDVDASALLEAFRVWAAGALTAGHDDAILVSGRSFVGSTVGLAPVGAVCAADYAVTINEARFSDAFVTVTVAHEIGHTLGMSHDSSGNSCPSSGFIMAAVGCSNCPTQPSTFSVCSQAYYADLVDARGTTCLDDDPGASLQPVCGNGITEAGEACDNGGDASDPCCNGATCALQTGATCWGDQGCCDEATCQPYAAGHTCRSSTGGCDLAETCDGGAACPSDGFVTAGTTCDDGITSTGGRCLEGDCASRAAQCASLESVFAAYAPLVQCNYGNTSCGNLLCGVFGDAGDCYTFTYGGSTVQVWDGTTCGSARQCNDGTCVDTSTLQDDCPSDPNKTSPGQCGCGVPDTDSDNDGTADCIDQCPNDGAKTAPGVCGCGTADTDGDGDGTPDCNDACASDPAKTAPGVCGCGVADVDSDGDATLDCQDACPLDGDKTAPGVCGCGVADVDSDGDATLDCQDACPLDGDKTAPGVCGCGVADDDSDGDGTADCLDSCPADADKTDPGTCGCGTPDEDITGDGIADCTVCGDGAIEAPETCDDGGRDPGDGCDALCQTEPIALDPVAPGTAGTRVTLIARGAQPGERVYFVAGTRAGSTLVPGCTVSVPFGAPTLIGAGTANANGVATRSVTIPSTLSGRTVHFDAAVLSRCAVAPEVVVTL
ncbi:MAG: hypothetical protein H6733_16700 [Alphaproteobacteria bacterium]|nr:hypothetical protein [Alphaproteobacteria bacterium]